eukprot:ANDGO_04914.mRNA.1 5-oxoprolinase
MTGKYRFSLDRGGTFLDCYVEHEGSCQVVKLLSEDPQHYSDAPAEAIRRVLGLERPEDIDISKIEFIRMGSTIVTNALLERKGVKTMLFITKGFQDLLRIGNQARPDIFDLNIVKPDLVYDAVYEVPERVLVRRLDADYSHLDVSYTETGVTGDDILVSESLTWEKLMSLKKSILHIKENRCIESAAVVLMHSYTFSKHELLLGRFLREELGFREVTMSHELMPMIRIVPRGFTTCVDAYLTPLIVRYIRNFARGFLPADQKEDTNAQYEFLRGANVSFMQSDGGLAPASSFKGSRAIFSGPAGGFVGYALTTKLSLFAKKAIFGSVTGDDDDELLLRPVPSIGLDIGGTSTDCSRYAGEGSFEHVYEVEVAGVQMQTPTLDIQTVASGGGSRLFFRNGMFVVGPESSGAHPGPLCYRKNGYLSLTDANLVLGRILPDHFPHIFGECGTLSLDTGASWRGFESLKAAHPEWLSNKSIPEIALAFVDVANETMCRPISNLTTAKGYVLSESCLTMFGGAGGQHACGIARKLGIRAIFIHRFSGILSAYGLSMASIVREEQEPCSYRFSPHATVRELQKEQSFVYERVKALAEKCVAELLTNNAHFALFNCEAFANVKFEGTDFHIMVPMTQFSIHDVQNLAFPVDLARVVTDFKSAYQRQYGFVFKERVVLIDDIRVRASVHADGVEPKAIRCAHPESPNPIPIGGCKMFADSDYQTANVYRADELCAGHIVLAPAVIIQNTSTIVIEPGFEGRVNTFGDIEIAATYPALDVRLRELVVSENLDEARKSVPEDPLMVTVFGHRFMSIAEQMGRALRRTAISTNIKERLDFSCAVFGPDGSLCANAPFIPVHLGSMAYAVQAAIKNVGSDWNEGDMVLTNHPAAGGTHLPDMTVISAVFPSTSDGRRSQPLFYVASRGHHADIGGITPGSMPPFSKHLSEEGVAVKCFKVVKEGQFDVEGIKAMFSQSRNVADNISDLQAQCAANQRGVELLLALVLEYGLPTVQAYCDYVQRAAERAVRAMLMDVVETQKHVMQQVGPSVYEVSAEDFMDDGTPIRCRLQIDSGSKSATLDFTGTGPQVDGNWNAPISICYSASIYVLRSLVRADIPLNQGCLNPMHIIVPDASILNPDEGRAVVGGNVLTSQRVVDVLLKAFHACAASQGCMNNFTFGTPKYGYYETICGGQGATRTHDGQSAVHTHMTNTRITDPEVLEKRYPVILRQFSIRKESGGAGRRNGGNGAVRELEFIDPNGVDVSILSERRVYAPYGLEGGLPGAIGENWKIAASGEFVKLQGKAQLRVLRGDRIRICTPGGGGYGAPATM